MTSDFSSSSHVSPLLSLAVHPAVTMECPDSLLSMTQHYG